MYESEWIIINFGDSQGKGSGYMGDGRADTQVFYS